MQNEIAEVNSTGTGLESGREGEGKGESATGSTDGIGGGGASGTVYIPLIEVTRMPIFKTRIAPMYPDEAKRREKEGTVILDVSISATGEVIDVVIKRAAGFGFDEAAIAAMRQSDFSPAFVGDQPVAVIVRVPIQFRFRD
jgi:protein TonB